MPGWDFAHAQDDVNPHMLRMFVGISSLDADHLLHVSTLIKCLNFSNN